MLKIGIESSAYFDMYDYEEGLKKLKRHGYNCIDYQNLSDSNCDLYKMNDMDFENYLRRLGETAKQNGVHIWQAHGKWPVNDQTESGRRETIDLFIKGIKGCNYLDCRYFVIHPFMPYGWYDGQNADSVFDMNVKMLSELMPYARKFGVCVCVENLPFPEVAISRTEEVKKLVQKINDPHCKVCFDTGHANVFHNDIASDISLLGEDLACLHVHDNKGNWDQHLIPYQGNIKWSECFTALKGVGFNGCFSIETHIAAAMPSPIKEEMQIALARLVRVMANEIR